MKYKIEITETLQRLVEVEAETLSAAIIKVGEDYGDAKIVLDYEDFKGYKIEEYKE